MLKGLLAAAAALVCFAGAAMAEPETVELDIGGKTALADLVQPGTSEANGVLLITHGTLAHKDMELMEALQTALAGRGVASLAHTLTLGLDRREGMYDCEKPHTHAHEDAEKEIAAWAAWLKDNGADRVWLLGHSRGGNQAASYAARQGGVEKLILMAPATGEDAEKAAASYKARFEADLAPLLEKARTLVEDGKGDEMIDMPGFIFCPEGKASARGVVSYYGGGETRDTTTHVPDIGAPILVIAGSADSVVPDVEEKFAPLADGEKLRLEVVQDADHMFLEFFAEDAADLVAEFVKE